MGSVTAAPTLAALFQRSVARKPRPDLLGARTRDGWLWIASQAALTRVRRIAAGLVAGGLQRGERVALMSENRPEWPLVDLGVQFAGGTDVPIYPTLPAEQAEYLLADSEARLVVVSTLDQARKLLPVLRRLTGTPPIVCMDGGAADLGVRALADLEAEGARALAATPSLLEPRLAAQQPSDVATILYTSGTTGNPKGVMLTHANLCTNVASVVNELSFDLGERGLSFLPLSHVFERIVTYAYLEAGVSIAYITQLERLPDAFVEIRPHIFCGVPALFELLRSRVLARVDKLPRLRRKLAERSLAWADAQVDDLVAGRALSYGERVKRAIADRAILRQIRARLGGELRIVVSGGAALPVDVARFFWAAGLPLLEGYGMTETSPVISVNRRGRVRLGTVGVPIAGVEVRIAQDGEILVRGPNVMAGYWRRPQDTARTIEDGFMHTGDLGHFEDGYLRISGRKKELLVLSSGKNVAPLGVEAALAQSPYVVRAVVVGDGRPSVSALIFPDLPRLEAWAAERGLGLAETVRVVDLPEVKQLLDLELARVQRHLADFEKVRRFEFLPEDLTEANGLLTPTQKVRRAEVAQRYAPLIERMYR